MASFASSSSRPGVGRARSNTTTTGLQHLALTEPASSVLLTFRAHPETNWPRMVLLNPLVFPYAKDGDIIRITQPPGPTPGGDQRSPALKKRAKEGFLFQFSVAALKVLENDQRRQGLKVSIQETTVSNFGFLRSGQVKLEVVDPKDVTADFVELYFKDQYIGRSDMWRLGVSWEGKCLQVGQELPFAGCIKAEVRSIYINKKRVPAAYFTARTKTIFRSSSAKCYIAIQVCREMYEFDEDGERYYEKALHGFLPELFARWSKLKTNHVVTVILFSRVCYDQAELERVEGPLYHDKDFGSYKDFYKVCVDMETILKPQEVISLLKSELANFQKAVLLDHNHVPGKEALILGTLSYAHQGNILEVVNLAINPYDKHYVDRDFVRTGLNLTVVTPGTGHFKVDKHLLRLTTDRCTDHGLSIDLVCLNKMPLHSVPLFSFFSPTPELGGEGRKTDGKNPREEERSKDPLYFDPATPQGGMEEMDLFYSVAFWVYCSFWSKVNDKRKKPGKFVSRVKMPQVQNMGVLNHDLTTIIVPHLEEEPHGVSAFSLLETNTSSSASTAPMELAPLSDEQRLVAQHQFDNDVFAQAYPLEPIGAFTAGTMDSSARRVHVHSPSSTNSMSVVPSARSPVLSSSYRALNPLSSSYNSMSGRLYTPQLSSSLGRTSQVPSPSPPSSGFVAEQPVTTTAFPKMPIQQAYGSTLTATASSTRSFNPPQAVGRESALSIKPPSRSASQASFASRSTVVRSPNVSETPTPSRPTSISSESPAPSLLGSEPSSGTQPSKKTKKEKGFKAWWSWTTGTAATPEETDVLASPEPPTPASQYQSSISSSLSPLSPSPMIPPNPRTSPLSIPTNRLPIARSAEPDQEEPQPRNSFASRSVFHSGGGQDGNLRGTPGSTGEQNMRDGNGRAPERQWLVNPCNPSEKQLANQNATHRWQHILPKGSMAHQVKWKSLVTPGCLPITTDYMPSEAELQKNYTERESAFPMEEFHESPFIITPASGIVEKQSIVREMALQRLAQGFQVVVASGSSSSASHSHPSRPGKGQKAVRSAPLPGGASEALRQSKGAIFMSLSNLIHRLEYTERDDSIRIRQYTRRLTYSTTPINYECVVWPILASGFQKVEAVFKFPSDTLGAFNWNKCDNLVTGDREQLDDSLTYWRARFIVIPSERDPDTNLKPGTNEKFTVEETHLSGADLLAALMTKARWIPPSEAGAPPRPVRFLRTTLDPSACVLDSALMEDLSTLQSSHPNSKSRLIFSKTSIEEVVKIMLQKNGGLAIGDTPWAHKVWPEAFTGDKLVSWLCETFTDIKTREDATKEGQKFFERGMFRHVHGTHQFNDGNYIYQLNPPYGTPKDSRLRFIPRNSTASTLPTSRLRRAKVSMSQEILIDVDPSKKSERSEVAFLHYDAIHNATNGFHFEFSWIGITAQLVEELRQNWARQIDRYGLRMIEAPSEPISEISSRQAFRACLIIPLALSPPTREEWDPQSNSDPRPSSQFFETALLRSRQFVLDIQSDDQFTDSVDVLYHRRIPYRSSQFVHRSGLAFVQCLPDGQGFQWLDNKLFSESKLEKSRAREVSIKERTEVLRQEFRAFCASKERLEECYAAAKKSRELEWEQQGYVASKKVGPQLQEIKKKAAPIPHFGSRDDADL
ncbi:hypothetical protein BDY24DRAFT_377030 [Mrakia frigida]|uniref:GTPase-activating protein IML1 n=1 Tax=Mrakia frigida TaxID=29902 RepID=UPI003FCC171D